MKKIINYLNRSEEVVASMLLILASLLVFVQAVFRYQFNYSLAWAEEIAQMMIAWFIFIGSSIAVRENAHINMDALVTLISGKAKHILSIIVDLINITFCLIIVIAGIGMISSAIAMGARATSIRIPLYIPYASVPVGVFLMLIRYVYNVVIKIKDLMTGNIAENEVEE
ncbi:C4-dicarboxylate transporter DctQ subunit [Natranaerovirga hydrolytica]|uniref:C4-dicarboxylate transporter DctQ subunit n=1 Tax=Natranaerovirga hydrolytica TaxID=680378 RepID=A0A4R1MZ86_9FIRM|nr:TRAP transporter small permease [Natranaerovirga hydrolytica]TCK98637.1 C4-dicarboxylate transporter DctQ subunit [Natranaerovirga hydrolytica]